MARPKLIFVYNADSGAINTLLDIGHKIISPSTYDCALCDLTHSVFRMRKPWSRFVASLDADCKFLHRDEYVSRYGDPGLPFPAIFTVTAGGPTLWIGRDEIQRCKTLEGLEKLVIHRLKTDSQPGNGAN